MRTAKITIENISGGWINDFAKTQGSSPMTRSNTYYTGQLNVNKPNFLGQISNSFGQNPTTISYAASQGYPVNATVDNNKNGYFFNQKGEISVVSLSSTWPSSHVEYTAPAGCTFDNYKDIWKYVTPATGTEAVYFTYQTASTAYVGYAPTASIPSRNNTFFALTNLSVPHVGCVSVKNLTYVTDGRYLRSFNADTSIWSQVDCGVGITLTSVVDAGNFVAAVGGNGASTWMFMWDGTALNLNYKYEIRDTSVTAIINEGGELRVFTYGKNNTTKIKTFNGSGFSEEADWETPTSLCPSPLHGMTDVWLNQIVWITPDGLLWTFGSPRKNELQSGAHRVGAMTTNTTSFGCVKNLYLDNLYIGINNASNSFIYNVKADTSYSSTLTSTFRSAIYEVPRNSTIERIQFFFSEYSVPGSSSSGSSLTASLYRDYSTTDMLNFSIPTRTDITGLTPLYYFPIKKSINELNSFYMNVSFTGITTIKKIVVTYSYEDNDL